MIIDHYLPDGYAEMIVRARTALYEEDIQGSRYERRLIERMTNEGWLVPETGSWSGEKLWRATDKALKRVYG